MKIDSHKRNLKESLEEIDEAVRLGLAKRQRSLGFHTSAACADMIELFLHQRKLIDPGFVVKHEWLKSDKSVSLKFNFEFQNKPEILRLAKSIESERNKLCYGALQAEELLEKVLMNFNKLKELLRDVVDESE